jgi:serine/threonine protein kinase
MTDKDFFERFVYDSEKDILGSGGFGTVYKAYDKFEKKYVAIKISQVKDIFGKFTLLNEVELSRKIDHHANVARYEFGLRVTQPFLIDYAVMDYYEDGNLDHVLKKNQGKLSEEERHDIVDGILEGLKHLHTEGVIHRDIKLANILMHKTRGGQWRPKIADFGLSRLMDSMDSSVSNSAIGITIAYAAPEQIENHPIKKNVDLWAFGVILYRLMTGRLPFAAAKGADPTSANLEMSRKIVMVDLPAEIAHIQQPYQYIIRRCLVKSTTERVQSAEELLGILKGKIKPPIVEEALPTSDITVIQPREVPIQQTPEAPIKPNDPEENDLQAAFIERSYPSVLEEKINEQTPPEATVEPNRTEVKDLQTEFIERSYPSVLEEKMSEQTPPETSIEPNETEIKDLQTEFIERSYSSVSDEKKSEQTPPETSVEPNETEAKDLQTEFIERSYPSASNEKMQYKVSKNDKISEKVLDDVSEKPKKNNQKLYIMVAGGFVALLALFFMFNNSDKTEISNQKNDATTIVEEEVAYKKAISEGTIPALESFINAYPNDKNVQAIKDSLKTLKTKSDGLINDIPLYIEDEDYATAKEYLIQLIKINPNDPSALKFSEQLKNK